MWADTVPQNYELKECYGSIFERSTTGLSTALGPVAFCVYGCGVCHSGDMRSCLRQATRPVGG